MTLVKGALWRLQAVKGEPAPLSAPSDAELAREVARGSADALEELYDRYGRPVFSMAYGILKDYALAEDLTQEAFAALWTRAGRFDESRGVFRHWFLHLAHNRALDELRRRKRIALVSADADPEDAALGLAAPGGHRERGRQRRPLRRRERRPPSAPQGAAATRS